MERPNWMEITLGAHKMRLFRGSRFLFLWRSEILEQPLIASESQPNERPQNRISVSSREFYLSQTAWGQK